MAAERAWDPERMLPIPPRPVVLAWGEVRAARETGSEGYSPALGQLSPPARAQAKAALQQGARGLQSRWRACGCCLCLRGRRTGRGEGQWGSRELGGEYVRRLRDRATRSDGRWRKYQSLPWGDGGECEKREEEEERQGRGDGGRQNKLTLGDSSGAEHGGGEPRGSRIWHGLARLRLR